MFHVEHIIGLLCVASAGMAGGAELLIDKTNSDSQHVEQSAEHSPTLPHGSAKEAVQPIVLATENEEAARLFNLGIQDVLMGYQTRARASLQQALHEEPDCVPALIGLMMLEQEDRSTYNHQLKRVSEILNSETYTATPEEIFYIETFLKMIAGGLRSAADDFLAHAERYRADVAAACWGILLLHQCEESYTSDGEASVSQAEALKRCDALLQRHVEHPLVLYVRAAIEENAPTISDTALQSAKRAAECMPDAPHVKHLLAHLQYRRNEFGDSLKNLKESIALYEQDLSTWNINRADAFDLTAAQLYQATGFFSNEQLPLLAESMKKLCYNIPESHVKRTEILIHQEARTLPLRILLSIDKPMSAKTINNAYELVIAPEEKNIDANIVHFAECIKSVLQVKALMYMKKPNAAQRAMKNAEQYFQLLKETAEQIQHESATTKICYKRQLDCASVALSIAKFHMFTDTKDIWKNKIDAHMQYQPRLLPPMIPSVNTKTKH